MLNIKAKNILLGKTCSECAYYRPQECCYDHYAKPIEPEDCCVSWTPAEENRLPITQGEIDEMLEAINDIIGEQEDE